MTILFLILRFFLGILFWNIKAAFQSIIEKPEDNNLQRKGGEIKETINKHENQQL